MKKTHKGKKNLQDPRVQIIKISSNKHFRKIVLGLLWNLYTLGEVMNKINLLIPPNRENCNFKKEIME